MRITAREPLNVLQLVPTLGQACGLDVLAAKLAQELPAVGVSMESAAALPPDADADVVLLWFHSDLTDLADIRLLRTATNVPLGLFAHSTGAERAMAFVDGFLTMAPGLAPRHAPHCHVFPHPASPEPLRDRAVLRRELGLPTDARVIGTSGFLRYERRFDDVSRRLVDLAGDGDWFVQLTISPWYRDSPGVLASLEDLRRRRPDRFGFEYAHLAEAELILRMQACDLLWCWTDAPPSPYASGVVATQYASGTRLVVADKLQHASVLALPNVVRAPATFDEFVTVLAAEAASSQLERHDPAPVSWAGVIDGIALWLDELAARAPPAR